MIIARALSQRSGIPAHLQAEGSLLRMRLAIINQPFDRVSFPVEGGSIKIWSHKVAAILKSLNHDVTVYARRGRNQTAAERFQNVAYRRVAAFSEPALLERFPQLWSISWPPHAWAIAYSTYFLRVAADLRRLQPDCVLVHNYSQALPILRAFCRSTKIALMMHCAWLQQFDRRMLGNRLAHADLLLGCSGFISAGIRKSFPQYSEKIRTVCNGADLDAAPPAVRLRNPARRVLFVGRISPEKGVHILVEAWEHVRATHPQANLRIAGPRAVMTPALLGDPLGDPLVEALVPMCGPSYASAWKLHPSIQFTGHIAHSKLLDEYRSADVFVFPSVWEEPFGLPIVEAMAAGIPVVATRSGGIPDIVEDGVSGIVVERGDADALARAIGLLLDDTPLRTRLAGAARERAKSFTWEHTASNLAGAFGSLQ
jgi:glycosyltransferase involved in cell wall biosynthesis